MTSKELYIYTLQEEIHRFKKVIQAVPEAGLGYAPHDRSQNTAQLLWNFEMESLMLIDILETGGISDFPKILSNIKGGSPAVISDALEENLTILVDKLKAATDEQWELPAILEGDGNKWETTREKMLWQLFLDLIHHRGQLSTYLRPMGAKVPSIYGPSGDDSSVGL